MNIGRVVDDRFTGWALEGGILCHEIKRTPGRIHGRGAALQKLQHRGRDLRIGETPRPRFPLLREQAGIGHVEIDN